MKIRTSVRLKKESRGQGSRLEAKESRIYDSESNEVSRDIPWLFERPRDVDETRMREMGRRLRRWLRCRWKKRDKS